MKDRVKLVLSSLCECLKRGSCKFFEEIIPELREIRGIENGAA